MSVWRGGEETRDTSRGTVDVGVRVSPEQTVAAAMELVDPPHTCSAPSME